MNKTLESVIPPTNPLAKFPYWSGPDANNLNGIACLEWVEAYVALMNKELPCRENEDTLYYIGRAVLEQKKRIQRRKEQGVLGTDKPHKSADSYTPGDIG